MAKPGDVVKVKVLSVDIPRKRIALTMRLGDPEGAAEPAREPRPIQRSSARSTPRPIRLLPSGGALADALRRAAEKGAKR